MKPRHHSFKAETDTKLELFISMKLNGVPLGWIFPAPIP